MREIFEILLCSDRLNDLYVQIICENLSASFETVSLNVPTYVLFYQSQFLQKIILDYKTHKKTFAINKI